MSHEVKAKFVFFIIHQRGYLFANRLKGCRPLVTVTAHFLRLYSLLTLVNFSLNVLFLQHQYEYME